MFAKLDICQNALEDVPDLVRVVVGTFEHLDLIARCGVSVSQVHAFTLVGPCNALVTGDSEQLVCVALDAGEDLQLLAVRGVTVGYVEALVTENLDIAILNGPSLIGRTDTVLNSDNCIVTVARSRQAHTCALSGADAVSSSDNWIGDVPLLVPSTSAGKDLSRVPVGVNSTCVVQAQAGYTQFNVGRAGGTTDDPLLVRVATEALEDLHLVAIDDLSISIVQARGAKDRDGVALGSP